MVGMYRNEATNFKEIACEDVESNHLSEDKFQFWDLVNTAMNLRVS